MGLILLNMATCQQEWKPYFVHRLEIIPQEIQKLLQSVKKAYSSKFFKILSQMLAQNPDQRPDLESLDSFLEAQKIRSKSR